MDYISSRAYVKTLASTILEISAKAKEDKKKGSDVIDATIGMFFDEDDKLGAVPSISESLKKRICEELMYGKGRGSDEFKNGILRWFLKDDFHQINQDYLIPFGSTIGGTGAITTALHMFLDDGETVILPGIMWENYKLLAQKNNLNFATYNLFKDNHFDIDDVKRVINEIALKQKSIVIILNDPCHNPTGYCLKKDEYHQLFDFLDEVSKTNEVTLLMDIAYIDYDNNSNKKHLVFDVALEKEYNFNIVYLFSCSKSFGIYGLRVGGIFTFTKNEDYYTYFMASLETYIRGSISCPNNAAASAIGKLLIDEEKVSLLRKEIEENTKIVINRGRRFVELLNEKHLKYLPYENGFFITLEVKDSQKLYEELMKKHVYVIPLDQNHIRISIASVRLNQLEKLANEILLSENI